MNASFDVNRGLENKGTSAFTKGIILFIVAALACVVFILVFNGKHNKLPGGIETNIPNEGGQKKDTVSVSNKTEINIKENNAPIIVK